MEQELQEMDLFEPIEKEDNSYEDAEWDLYQYKQEQHIS
jgi:hypothetical protein